jgi:hypothetical protein
LTFRGSFTNALAEFPERKENILVEMNRREPSLKER